MNEGQRIREQFGVFKDFDAEFEAQDKNIEELKNLHKKMKMYSQKLKSYYLRLLNCAKRTGVSLLRDDEILFF